LGSHFWLSRREAKRRKKSDPHARSARMCFFMETSRPLSRDVDSVLTRSNFLAKAHGPAQAYGKTQAHAAMLAIVHRGVQYCPVAGMSQSIFPEYKTAKTSY